MTMKKYMLIAAAAIIALSACTKESGIVDKEESRSSDYFTASIEKTDITRATFDAGAKCASWQVGDRINIDGKLYEAQEEGTVTTFAAIGQAAGGSTHKAYFPASLCDAEQNLVLPSTINEEYVEGRFNMPMYAQSTTKDLAFKNLCGVLKITVKSSEIDKVKSIRISSQSRALSGRFTVKDNAAVLTDRLTIANTLEVIYYTSVPLDTDGKVFYVAVPAETYRDLLIDVSNGKDHLIMATKTEWTPNTKQTLFMDTLRKADGPMTLAQASEIAKVEFKSGTINTLITKGLVKSNKDALVIECPHCHAKRKVSTYELA